MVEKQSDHWRIPHVHGEDVFRISLPIELGSGLFLLWVCVALGMTIWLWSIAFQTHSGFPGTAVFTLMMSASVVWLDRFREAKDYLFTTTGFALVSARRLHFFSYATLDYAQLVRSYHSGSFVAQHLVLGSGSYFWSRVSIRDRHMARVDQEQMLGFVLTRLDEVARNRLVQGMARAKTRDFVLCVGVICCCVALSMAETAVLGR